MKKFLGILAISAALGACSTATPVETAITLVCPPSMPSDPKCSPCPDYERPEFTTVPQLKRALVGAEKALVQCRVTNDACVQRDWLWTQARAACDNPR